MFKALRSISDSTTAQLLPIGYKWKMSGHSNVGKGERYVANRKKPNSQTASWPSDDHKCVMIYHNDSVLTVKCLENHVKKYGNIVKSRTLPASESVVSSFEMATSSEAEHVWKGVLEQKLEGVLKAFPDREHQTILTYAPYWSSDKVEKGIKSGSVIFGCLRVNPRLYHLGFVSDADNPDIVIDSVMARNRALPGDIVAVQIRDQDQWRNQSNLYGMKGPCSTDECHVEINDQKIKTGDVVEIIERRHNRLCVGVLAEKRKHCILFRPLDNCMPRLLIPHMQCPSQFFKNPKNFENKLFLASIVSWNENDVFAEGCLQKFIGNKGEIEVETQRILLENDVDASEFEADVEDLIVKEYNSVPIDEYSRRRDLRSECVFTIDPETAKDLDDALHCRKISENTYEVGVHIADVSFYVQPGTKIDKIASKRCTSVYLVQRTIPMLPNALCEKLCSLNPDQDKLTYSIIWKLTGQGEILDTWYGRTVIRSCVKLTYENAQSFIDYPNADLDASCYPIICGGHNLSTVRSRVMEMHSIAQSLRKKRSENGALRLDQIKLAFTLDEDTKMPNSCFSYTRQSSNELVEELMLLANISVAQKLSKSLPQQAFLRRHPAPRQDLLKKFAGHCARQGWKLDISSSGNLARSLRQVKRSDGFPENAIHGLIHFMTKPQELALYFCAGAIDRLEDYHHYALNVPFYTHFTSPIRRYADIIVHRQLSSIQGSSNGNEVNCIPWEDLQKQADLCNIRKARSRKVQEISVQLYFYAMIKTVGLMEDRALVLHVHDHCFDVLSLSYGLVIRIYVDNLPLVGFKHLKQSSTLEIIWPCNGDEKYKLTDEEMRLAQNGNLRLPRYSSTLVQAISEFCTVDVIFEANEKEFKIKAYLKKPQKRG